ncbi:MAG TPA: signal peptidase I [Actinomycetota bacterium]|nr:signal peptidase I [Actinomycetota bacterium]
MIRPGSSSRLRPLRVGLLGLAWAVGGFGFGLLAAVGLPGLLGLRSLTVLSGSMRPTIGPGDVVVVERIDPRDARVGDVISFVDPEDPRRILTHRVRDVAVEGPSVAFVTKGDANTAPERWRVPVTGTIGRVVYRVPLVGYLLLWAGSRAGRLLLVVLPALALGAIELRRIWRPRPEEVRGAQPGEVRGARPEGVRVA